MVEYKVTHQIRLEYLEDKLNQFENEDWELVTVLYTNPGAMLIHRKNKYKDLLTEGNKL